MIGPYRTVGEHARVAYLGESKTARAAYRCDDCGAHWYPEMGERPPARCHPAYGLTDSPARLRST